MVEKNKHDKIGLILSIFIVALIIFLVGASLLNQIGKNSITDQQNESTEGGIVSISTDYKKNKIEFGNEVLIIPAGHSVTSKATIKSGEKLNCEKTIECIVFYISNGEKNNYFFSTQGEINLTSVKLENVETESFTVGDILVDLEVEKSYLYDFDDSDSSIKTDAFTYSSIAGCLDANRTLCFTTENLPLEIEQNKIEVNNLRSFLKSLSFE